MQPPSVKCHRWRLATRDRHPVAMVDHRDIRVYGMNSKMSWDTKQKANTLVALANDLRCVSNRNEYAQWESIGDGQPVMSSLCAWQFGEHPVQPATPQ
ncbi:hypothetical protein BCEP4_1440011 [Burkholderia cepacia]|nr:hypothetical protein BCEP4_1440011 [Burkholderia cepacia]